MFERLNVPINMTGDASCSVVIMSCCTLSTHRFESMQQFGLFANTSSLPLQSMPYKEYLDTSVSHECDEMQV